MFIKIHIVQQGDTLQTIMKQYSTTKQSIEKANPHIANVDTLMSGMKIKITSTARSLQPRLATQAQRIKPLKQQNQNEDDFLHAQAHRRPIGDVELTYDQKWNAYRYIMKPSINLQRIESQSFCHHCQQPIYYVTN